MKLKDFVNVFNGDIYLASIYRGESKTIQVVPIGNTLKGIQFVMDLQILQIDPALDTLGAVVFVDVPPEIMPGIIACNDNFSLTMEWDNGEEW